MLSANVFELCRYEGRVTVIGRLSQCSHASRPGEIKKFYGRQTTVRHPGKGQFVITSQSRGHFCAKAPSLNAVLLQYSPPDVARRSAIALK